MARPAAGADRAHASQAALSKLPNGADDVTMLRPRSSASWTRRRSRARALLEQASRLEVLHTSVSRAIRAWAPPA